MLQRILKNRTRHRRRRVNASFPTEGIEHLEPRKLLSAVNGDSTAVSEADQEAAPPEKPTILTPNTEIGSDRPQFTWAAVEGATQYRVEIYDVNTGQLVIATNVEELLFRPKDGIEDGHKHQFFVKAINDAGESEWSKVGFAADTETPPAPTLSDVGVESVASPTINWQAVDGADRYELVIYHTASGQEVLRRIDLTKTSFQPEFWWSHKGDYQVYVRAIRETDGVDNAGSWSGPKEFHVDGTQPTTVEFNSVTRQLTWPTIAGADRYEVLIYNKTRGQEALPATRLTESEFKVPDNTEDWPAEDTYQVFLRGIDADGTAGVWNQISDLSLNVGQSDV